jgi:SPOR domain
MAAHIGHPASSRRFIKMYLSTWALLASGALVYLAVLAFPPSTDVPAPRVSLTPEQTAPNEVTVRQVKTAEVKNPEVHGSLSEVRKDASQPQEAQGERTLNEKIVQTPPNAAEDRIGAVDGQQPPPAAVPAAKVPGISVLAAVPAPGAPTPAAPTPAAPTPAAPTPAAPTPAAPTPAVPAPSTLVPAGPAAPAPAPAAEAPFKPVDEPAAVAGAVPPAPPIETGSIPPKPEIVFGEPVVTRAGPREMAVQLASGPSLQAVRQSWEELSERYGLLAALQPRVVAPRAEGGVYRLLAGPFSSRADAERICSQLGVGAKACFATQYAGAPL